MWHPIFYGLPPLLEVFLGVEGGVAAESEVFAFVSVASGLSLGIAVFASADIAAVVFAAAVSAAADIAEPQASGNTPVPSAVSVPVSVVVVGADSPGRPTFFAFPNVDRSATAASSGGDVGGESVHSATGSRTSYGLCSILSTLGLRHNRRLEYPHNDPSPCYNSVSDTSHLAMDATTSHSRKKRLYRDLEQHKHCPSQAAVSHPGPLNTHWWPVGPLIAHWLPTGHLNIHWWPAYQHQHLYLPAQWLEEKLSWPMAETLLQKAIFSNYCLLSPSFIMLRLQHYSRLKIFPNRLLLLG
jgi:hypothetical protein